MAPFSLSNRFSIAFAGVALCMTASCSKSKPATKAEGAAAPASAASLSAEPTVNITVPAGMRLATAEQLLARIKATTKKGVVLNAWASWCGPCQAEVPMLATLSQQLPDLEFLFVSVDELDKLAPAGTRVKEWMLPRPTYVAMPPLDVFKAGLNPRWQGSLPSTFLFDPTGQLRYWWGAEVFEPEIRPKLDDYLAGKEIDGEANFKVRHEPRKP